MGEDEPVAMRQELKIIQDLFRTLLKDLAAEFNKQEQHRDAVERDAQQLYGGLVDISKRMTAMTERLAAVELSALSVGESNLKLAERIAAMERKLYGGLN